MTREEITDLAFRYITPEESVDFPMDNEPFYFLSRTTATDKVLSDEEGWQFQGYGICTGYTMDEEAKPRGKWLWMHYTNLSTFPPFASVVKLQPPHVAKGQFQNPDRSMDIKVVKLTDKMAVRLTDEEIQTESKPETAPEEKPSNIVQFRKKSLDGPSSLPPRA